MTAPPLLEVCVDDLSGLEAAVEGGADRIELCSALALGGLTPSLGLMEIAGAFDIPCNAMIRPRAGDFVYSGKEVDVMLADIEAARESGLAGVVLGASLPDGRLDRVVLQRLAEAAEGLDMTLHRAFDLVPDIAEPVALAIKLGFSRILTSGGAQAAAGGLPGLKQAIAAAKGLISIMPGAGISAANASEFLALGISEFHASCSIPIAPPVGRLLDFGFQSGAARRTDAATVAALKSALASRPQIFGRDQG